MHLPFQIKKGLNCTILECSTNAVAHISSLLIKIQSNSPQPGVVGVRDGERKEMTPAYIRHMLMEEPANFAVALVVVETASMKVVAGEVQLVVVVVFAAEEEERIDLGAFEVAS